MVVIKKQGTEISLVVGMKTAKVNGKEIKLDTSSVMQEAGLLSL